MIYNEGVSKKISLRHYNYLAQPDSFYLLCTADLLARHFVVEELTFQVSIPLVLILNKKEFIHQKKSQNFIVVYEFNPRSYITKF